MAVHCRPPPRDPQLAQVLDAAVLQEPQRVQLGPEEVEPELVIHTPA